MPPQVLGHGWQQKPEGKQITDPIDREEVGELLLTPSELAGGVQLPVRPLRPVVGQDETEEIED